MTIKYVLFAIFVLFTAIINVAPVIAQAQDQTAPGFSDFLKMGCRSTATQAQNQPMSIYAGSLQNGWQNWSWAQVNLSSKGPSLSGSTSIAVTMSGWSGLYLHHDAFNSSPYATITFWVNGGETGGQRIQLQATLDGQPRTAYPIGPLMANTWTQVTVPLVTLGVANASDLDGFWLQDITGGSQPTFYVDNMSFTAGAALPPPPMAVYEDTLENNWQNWSWAFVDFSAANPVHSGSDSIAVTMSAWSGLYLHQTAFDSAPYGAITFWVNGGATGGQCMQLVATRTGQPQTGYPIGPLAPNTWTEFSVSLSNLGVANVPDLDGFWLQDTTGAGQPTFYVDDISFTATVEVAAQALDVYTDSLQDHWQNWSWASCNFSNTSPVHSGSDSVAVTMSPWSGLYLHQTPFDSTAYTALTFWVNGGSAGGQLLRLQGTLSEQPQSSVPIGPLAANTWTQVTVPLTSLGVEDASDLDGFWLQEATGFSQPTFYVDDISFITTAMTLPTTTVTIDASANRHAISPLIYGVAYATTAELVDLNAPINLSGGDNESRYNWQINADNKAADWFFESLGYASSTPGEHDDTFIGASKSGGAEPMVTIPMLSWVAKLGPNRSNLSSFSVAKYGAQQSTDRWMPDAGNGVNLAGRFVTGNDPSDANVPSDVNFQAGWVNHIVSTWGAAANGGLNYYILDNEPSIWHGMHRDVHPIGATMDEVSSDIVTYAAKIKSIDPNALVCAPEEWGWTGYFYSGYDQQQGAANGWSNFPDRAAHGGADYLPWLLGQMATANQAAGHQLVDIFTVHYFPQSGEYSSNTSAKMQLLRNRSTRELWDPNYTSESWIASKVYLIPRLKAWVSQYCPGMKIGITQYNWAGDGSINAGTTQADVLGIFGQQGLDLATRWTVPESGTPAYYAMKMYRNYDGNKSGFGDTSVSDIVQNPDNLSSFASVRASDGALTVFVISKVLSGNTPVDIDISNFACGSTAQVWQLTSSNCIQQLSDVSVSSGAILMTVPAQSVTLLVIQSSGPSIMSVSPNKVGAGSAAFTMPVTGSQFVSGASVVWNGEKLATTFVSSSRLNASVPASAVSTPGSASIMVVQSSMKSNVVSLPIANVGPPVTSWMLTSSAMGSDGWCKAPARVTISATDPEGPANVASILYQVDRGLLTKYTGPFTVIGEGIHTVTGKSTDEIGNVGPLWTFTIKIDRTAPVTTLTSNAGTITLAAVDSLSGIASTTYSIDGASMQTYKGPFTIKGASGHAITYRSTNRAGIVEAQKRSVVFVLQPKPIITQVAEAPRVSN